MSHLSYVQKFFCKMKLVKTSLPTQLRQTNLGNWLYISTESPKEGFNVFLTLQYGHMSGLKTSCSVFVFIFSEIGSYVTFKNDL